LGGVSAPPVYLEGDKRMTDKLKARLEKHMDSIIERKELTKEDISVLMYLNSIIEDWERRKEDSERIENVVRSVADFASRR
jgi:hypothetical protein